MLINDLANAFDRLVKDQNCEIKQGGFCFGTIDNLVVIDIYGNLKEIIQIPKPIREKLPENLCSGGKKKNILYDSLPYFFGIEYDSENSKYVSAISGKGKDKLSKFEDFKNANLKLLKNVDNDTAKAIINFLDKWKPDDNLKNPNFFIDFGTDTQKARSFKGNFAFCLNDITQKSYLDQTIIAKIKDNIKNKINNVTADGVCCISGKYTKIAGKHKPFSGAQAFLISVDNGTPSFHSYNKTWCYDSPVSEEIMNKYTSVLNYFYRNGSKNKTSFGKDILMFWADCDSGYEDEILTLLGQTPTIDDIQQVENKIMSSLEQLKQGLTPTVFKTEDNTNFYLLLLSKKLARFSVKKYLTTTFGLFRDNVLQHYADMELVGIEKPIPIWQLLSATVSSTKNDDLNPNFNGVLTDSISNKSKYPTEIFNTMIERFKTDNSTRNYNSNKRVAFIKACLVRKARLENKKEDIKMSLNIENKDEAYLLGRLFAVMEKAQQDAIPNANTTIKDRYFASACSTPASVFPTLLIGYQNHISKLEKSKIYYEILVGEIVENLDNKMPKQLDLDNQGRFIIGYYQQRIALWTKQANIDTAEKENKEE